MTTDLLTQRAGIVCASALVTVCGSVSNVSAAAEQGSTGTGAESVSVLSSSDLFASDPSSAAGGMSGLGKSAGFAAATTTASDELDAIRAELESGRVLAARGSLSAFMRSVPEREQMSAGDQATLWALSRRVSRAEKSLTPAEVSLQKAGLMLEEGDLVGAEHQLEAVRSRSDSGSLASVRAESMLGTIAERRAEIESMGEEIAESAIEDFENGSFAQAKAGLLLLSRAGVTLGEQTDVVLARYRERIVDLELARGSAFEIAGVGGAMAGMLQPGTVRRIEPADETDGGDSGSGRGGQPDVVEIDPETGERADGGERADEPGVIEMPDQGSDRGDAGSPQPSGAASEGDIVRQAVAAEARRLLADADSAFADNRLNEAEEKYATVVSSFAAYLNEEELTRARDRLAETRVRLNSNIAGGDLAESVRQNLSLLQQQTEANIRAAIEDAREALDGGLIDEARQKAAFARLELSKGRDYLGEQFERFREQVDQLNASIERRAEEIRRAEARELETDLARREREIRQQEAEKRQEKINENITRIRQLQREQKYREALQVVDRLLFLDQNNPTGLLLRDIIRDIVLFQEFASIRAEKNTNFGQLELENSGATIPPDWLVEYPEDWPKKTFTRGEQASYQESAENRRVLATLDSVRLPADFEDNRFEDVVAFLQGFSGLTVDIDWESLDEIGVDEDTEITFQTSANMPMRVLLESILDKASPDDFSRVDWAVKDGVLKIASEQALRRDTTLVIYNITDLLLEIEDYPDVPEIDLDSLLDQGEGGGGGQSPFEDEDEEEEEETEDEKIEELIGIIQENVDFEGWRDNGGETGTVQEYNGSLIITNTPKNHRQIVGLLSKLREIRNMQINVETKFLLVNQNWFEQIGFDLDIVLNANNNQVRAAQGIDPTIQGSDFFDFTQGGLQRDITGSQFVIDTDMDGIPDTPVIQGVQNPQGWSPIGAQQNSLGLVESLAEGDFANSILSAAPALGIAGQFLDDIQVDFLIQATQADQRTVQLTAPRLTFTNGQTANIFVVTQQAFVSDLEPVTSESAVGFDPEVDVVNEGVTMLVEGVISADRRYVTMNIDAGIGRIDGFAQQPVTAVAGGQLVNSADTQSFIQLPTVTVTRVRTTATIPDEGTILLGGQRLVTEVEVETGVPVLSKIPIINRFFTNRLESKEEQTLLILAKPTILIQSEEEERAFPGLADEISSGTFGIR